MRRQTLPSRVFLVTAGSLSVMKSPEVNLVDQSWHRRCNTHPGTVCSVWFSVSLIAPIRVCSNTYWYLAENGWMLQRDYVTGEVKKTCPWNSPVTIFMARSTCDTKSQQHVKWTHLHIDARHRKIKHFMAATCPKQVKGSSDKMSSW